MLINLHKPFQYKVVWLTCYLYCFRLLPLAASVRALIFMIKIFIFALYVREYFISISGIFNLPLPTNAIAISYVESCLSFPTVKIGGKYIYVVVRNVTYVLSFF